MGSPVERGTCPWTGPRTHQGTGCIPGLASLSRTSGRIDYRPSTVKTVAHDEDTRPLRSSPHCNQRDSDSRISGTRTYLFLNDYRRGRLTLNAPLARVLRIYRIHEQSFRLSLVLDILVETVKRPFRVLRCLRQSFTDTV